MSKQAQKWELDADEDLRTPKHDEIMLWLDKHAATVIKAVTGIETGIWELTWEYPITEAKYYQGIKSQYMIGFADMYVVTKDRLNNNGCRIVFFEVKSVIPSPGELIRQVNRYRTYIEANPHTAEHIFVVVSPDARYADVLKSQGIEFYHCQVDAYEEAMK